MGNRIILNIENWDNALLATRAARHLIDNPDKPECLLEFKGLDGGTMAMMWAKRGKIAIIVYEQPKLPTPERPS